MPNPTHDEILAELPKPYRDIVDKSTARGNSLDQSIIAALALLAVRDPKTFKRIQNKLERKNKK
jgi:hypothetical protein